jgi:hypothetical protein
MIIFSPVIHAEAKELTNFMKIWGEKEGIPWM